MVGCQAQDARRWVLELENARLSLEPPLVRRSAEALWANWSIQHPQSVVPESLAPRGGRRTYRELFGVRIAIRALQRTEVFA